MHMAGAACISCIPYAHGLGHVHMGRARAPRQAPPNGRCFSRETQEPWRWCLLALFACPLLPLPPPTPSGTLPLGRFWAPIFKKPHYAQRFSPFVGVFGFCLFLFVGGVGKGPPPPPSHSKIVSGGASGGASGGGTGRHKFFTR